MAEQRMYKGRPIKPNVQIKKEMIDGVEREILVMPSGMKDPYADGETKKPTAKKTTKPNPQKETILESIINTFSEFATDEKVYKSKGGKFTIKVGDKYFTLALTANKSIPQEMEEYNLNNEGD